MLTDIEYLLRRNWETLWPDAKLFASAFLVRYGRSPVVRRVKEMADELGVSDRLVTRACRELEQAGFLSRSPYGTPAHRPSFEYQLTAVLLGRIRDEGKRRTASSHDLILKVVTSERRKGRKPGRTVDSIPVAPEVHVSDGGETDALDVSERLLLMILLAHADVTGSVRGYGFRDLSRLTGMGKSRVQSSITRLRDKGLLRAFVPGASPGSIFHCAPGAYFLNLQHPVFGGIGRFSHMLVYDVRGEQRGEGNEANAPLGKKDAITATAANQELREAHQLLALFGSLRDMEAGDISSYEVALSRGQRLIYIRTGYLWGQVNLSLNEELKELAPLFDGQKRPHLADYLQMKLEEYAADMLTHHWTSLKALTHSEVKEKIWREAFGGFPEEGKQELSKDESLQCHAVELLFALARGMAESIQRVMMMEANMPHGSMVHSLLPDVVKGPREQFVVVSVHPSAIQPASECKVTFVRPSNRLVRLRVFRRCTYDQLTRQELHDMGLLSCA